MKFKILISLVIGFACLVAAESAWAQRSGRRNGNFGADQNQADQNQADQNQAGQNQAGQNQAGQNQAGQNQAGQNQAGQNQAGQNQAGQNQAGQNQNQQDPDGADPNGQNPGGQNPGGQNPGGQTPYTPPQNNPPDEDVKLPDDPRLLDLHRQFVVSAEKLGADYEKNNQFDKARACYEEVVRLVPSYAKGKDHLEQAKAKQATAERKIVSVLANEDWHDSGVTVAAGKPVIVTATGFWDFRMSADVTADGMEIPKELRDFNLGSLVGMVDDGNPKDAKPFFIGAHLEFTSHRTGRLLLRMYDSDLSDNTGKLQVTVTGSFVTGGKKQAPINGSSAAN